MRIRPVNHAHLNLSRIHSSYKLILCRKKLQSLATLRKEIRLKMTYMDTPKSPVIKLKTYEIINCIKMSGRPFMYVSIVFTSIL